MQDDHCPPETFLEGTVVGFGCHDAENRIKIHLRFETHPSEASAADGLASFDVFEADFRRTAVTINGVFIVFGVGCVVAPIGDVDEILWENPDLRSIANLNSYSI